MQKITEDGRKLKMRLSDIFRFKRKQTVQEHDTAEDFDKSPSEHIAVDVTNEYVYINNKQYTLPIKMEVLIEMFGKPQIQTFGKIQIDELDEEDNDFLNAIAGQRINYCWNELGIYAYTHDAIYAKALLFMLRPGISPETPDIFPKNMFGGKITINGREWFESLKKIKPEYSNSANKSMTLGRHKIYGQFTDNNIKDRLRTEKSYSYIDIDLRMD